MPTIPGWLLSLVIHYILAQLAKLGTTVDWGKLPGDTAAEVLAAVDKFLPAWLQAMVNPGLAAVVIAAVGAVEAACADTADLQTIVDDLQAGNWNQALADLEALLGKIVHPSAAAVAGACASCHITGAQGLVGAAATP